MNMITLTVWYLNYLLLSRHSFAFKVISDTQMSTCSFRGFIYKLDVLIKQLQWKEMVILQNEEGLLTTSNLCELRLPTVKTVVYTVVAADNLHRCFNEIYHSMFPRINLILSGNTSFVEDVIMELDSFDESTHFTTDFRHHSKVLIIGEDRSVLGLQNKILHLENVALIIPTKTSPSFEDALTLHRHPHGNVLNPVSACGADVSMCYFPNVRYGYNNRLIRVITLESFKFTIKESEGKGDVFKGYSIDILHGISRSLNLSYRLGEPEDGSWGLQQNGSWNGIVKELQDRNFDLAASELHVTKGRGSAVDFIYPPIYTDAVTILYRTYQPPSIFLIAKPLHWMVYIVTLVTAVVMTVLFHFTERHLTTPRETSSLRVPCCSENIVRALFKQGLFDALTGAQSSPVTESGKILISFWWMFLVIITGVFSANLSASLSSPKRIHPFKSLQEFLESDFSLVPLLQGMTMSLFKNSDLEAIKELRMKVSLEVNMQSSMKENIKKIKEDKAAVLTYCSVAEQHMAEDCELEVIKERLFFHQLAFAVPKRSALKNDLEQVMSSLRESGTLDLLWNKWFKKRNATTCVSDNRVKPISIEIFAGGFFILCVGIVISALVLCFEKLK